MTNSSIPADSLGSPAPVSASFLWDVPNKPVSIQISLDVVDRMEREVIDSFKAVTKRGSEVGGILLGRVAHSGRRTVFVENYEAVTCDYSRGPLYLLADPDKDRLKEVLERLKASPLSAVGFFRSNTRKDLVLDEEDLALAQEFFSDPNQVFLLVKPFAMKPSTAGFFVWQDGQVQAESCLEFPFRRSELQKLHAQSIVQAGGSRAAEAGPSGPPREDRSPVVFPKREERPVAAPPVFARREEPRPGPVIVPSRREEPAAIREEPAAAPPPVVPKREDAAPAKPAVPPVIPKREDRPAAPPLTFKREERPPIAPAARREERPAPVAPKREDRPTVAPASLKRDDKPAPPPVQEEQPKRDDRPPVTPHNLRREDKAAVKPRQEEPAKREERPVAKREAASPAPAAPAKVEKKEEPAPVMVPPPSFGAAAMDEAVASPLTSEPAKSGMPRWILIAVVLVLIAAAGAYFAFFRGKQATQIADAGLSLRVERNAGQLVLTWNRNAAVIASAQKSTLSIIDGDHKEDVDLDLGTLRSGSIVYSPITNDVGFRLEVAGANGGSPIGESVRALAGRPSPLMQQAPLKETAPADAKALASQQTPGQPQAAVTTPTSAAPAAQAPPPVVESAKPSAPVTLIPPKPDSLAARLRPAEQLAEPPSLEGGSSGSISARALPGQTALAPPPPAASRPEPPKPAAQTNPQAARMVQGVKVGGKVEEAVVLRRTPPTYPALARQARVYGVVRVEAQVGADGRVKSARALSGPPLLRQAAAEAVQRWQYQPGRLNGEPVDVTTQVDVSFTLNR